MIHILTVIGARPQFIKAAVLSRRLREDMYSEIKETIIHTGQHYDPNMSEIFFKSLDIPEPYLNLNINGGSHSEQLGKMMSGVEQAIDELKPNAVLVYGDTNSTLATALAAAHKAIPIIHVEAGLRSFREGMPEEINRILTDRLSKLLFCPNEISVNQLSSEGKTEGVYNVGDIMFESYLYCKEKNDHIQLLDELKIEKRSYILATLHRQENTNDEGRLSFLLDYLNHLSKEKPIIFPIHPRTKKIIVEKDLELSKNIICIEPIPYDKTIGLLKDSLLLATDSGGMQKEAFYASIPCMTMRDETEWKETVEEGWNTLIPLSLNEALKTSKKILDEHDYSRVSPLLYGDGKTSEIILNTILKEL